MSSLGKRATRLSFERAHKNKIHKHKLPSCRVAYGGPFSWSVAHYISHYVFTHIWPFLCTCWGVIYQLCVYTCSSSSTPPSLNLTLLPSISHFSPYHSICLPVSPPAPLHPPRVSDGDHAVAKATGAIVYPVARWLVAVAMIKNSEAPPPPLPLLLLLPSIDKSSQFFSSFFCPSLPPPDYTTRRKARRPLRGTKQQWRDGMDDGLFVFIS